MPAKFVQMFIITTCALMLGACANAAPTVAPQESELGQFEQTLQAHPDQIWSPTINAKLKSAIYDYEAKVHEPSGLIYGESVRTYSLKGKCPFQIERDLKQMGCAEQVDVIREPKMNQPIVSASGQTTPILQFVCPDGGVFKIKPDGDPTNRYTPFPHGSRTLRYPADSPYRDYRDEVAKVSESGHIIPRGPADLGSKNLVRGWSADAHVRLGLCP